VSQSFRPLRGRTGSPKNRLRGSASWASKRAWALASRSASTSAGILSICLGAVSRGFGICFGGAPCILWKHLRTAVSERPRRAAICGHVSPAARHSVTRPSSSGLQGVPFRIWVCFGCPAGIRQRRGSPVNQPPGSDFRPTSGQDGVAGHQLERRNWDGRIQQ
jgi:hypothetical protein